MDLMTRTESVRELAQMSVGRSAARPRIRQALAPAAP
jgi:hypothetical protein